MKRGPWPPPKANSIYTGKVFALLLLNTIAADGLQLNGAHGPLLYDSPEGVHEIPLRVRKISNHFKPDAPGEMAYHLGGELV